MVAKRRDEKGQAGTITPGINIAENMVAERVKAPLDTPPAYQDRAIRLAWEYAWERLDRPVREIVALLTLLGSSFTLPDLTSILRLYGEEYRPVTISPRLLIRLLIAAGALDLENNHHYLLNENWSNFVATTPEGSISQGVRQDLHVTLARAFLKHAEETHGEEGKFRLLREAAYHAYHGHEHTLLASLLFVSTGAPLPTALLDKLYLEQAIDELRAYFYRLASVPVMDQLCALEASRQLAYTALLAKRPTWSGCLFKRLAEEAEERDDQVARLEAVFGMGVAALELEDFHAAANHFEVAGKVAGLAWLGEATALAIVALEAGGQHGGALRLCREEMGDSTPAARAARFLAAGDLALPAGKYQAAGDLYQRGLQAIGKRSARPGLNARLHIRLAYLTPGDASHRLKAAELLNRTPHLSCAGRGAEHLAFALQELELAREEFEKL